MKEFKKALLECVFEISTAFTIFVVVTFISYLIIKPEIFKNVITGIVCMLISVLITIKLDKTRKNLERGEDNKTKNT